MRLSLLIAITCLIMTSLLLSGCPEKSPPVTHNQNSFSLIPKVYAEPTQPTTPVTPRVNKKPAMKIKKTVKKVQTVPKTKDDPKKTQKEKDPKSVLKDQLKNKVRDPKMPPPPT